MISAEKKRWIAATAKNRAITRVKENHFDEYQQYYKEEADKLRAEAESEVEQALRAKYYAEFQAELKQQK